MGADLPGLAAQVLLLLISILLLPLLLSWLGQDRYLLGSVDRFWLLSGLGSSKSLEKSGPEQMYLWTAVHLLTPCDGL